jgi:VWFA-related protein
VSISGVLPMPAGSHAQEPVAQVPSPQVPVFRSGVQLLEVDVVASDARGRPVMDLAKEEFELYDEGRRQDIAFFAAVSLPIQPPRPPVIRDVASNASAEDGRLFVLVLDDIHSHRVTTPVIKAAAHRLVERLSPQDQLAVLWISTEKQGAFEFTSNHAAVLAAIDEFSARKPQVSLVGLSVDVPDSAVGGQEYFERIRPFSMVDDLCQYLAGIPRRRKAIVYVGQGPTGQLLSDTMNADTDVWIMKAAQEARRANVALYVIDPSGPLKAGVEGYLDEAGPLSFRDLARIRQDTMGTFSAATGGFWGTGSRAVDLVDRIVTETSRYYLLGFYPPPPTSRALRWLKELAGNPWARFHGLDVRTTRPGVTIRARKGYFQDDALPGRGAPAPGERGSETARAIAGVLPRSSLPLRGVAVPFRGDVNGQAHPVVIAAEVTASPRKGQRERAELLAAAVEPGTSLRASHRAVASFAADPSRAPVTRYLLWDRLDLKPGRYQLRLGVQSAWAQATGSVYVDVTVPDFRKAALSMSGLVLDQQSSVPAILAVRTSSVTTVVPALPSLARTFPREDEVWTVVEIYRGPGAPAAPVEVVTTMVPEGGASAVWHERQSFPPAAFGAASKVVCRVLLPIAALAPGAYRLRVTATTAAPIARGEALRTFRELDVTIAGAATVGGRQ